MNKDIPHRLIPAVVLTALVLACCTSLPIRHVPTELAASDKVRLVWNDDPTSTITIIWDQLEGQEATVFYGKKDQGRKFWKYPNHQV